MVKFYERKDDLKFSWEQVARAFWNRYPNPYSSHVLSEDVVSRHQKGRELYTKRLLTKTNHVPKWGEKLISVRHVRIIEESIVNSLDRTITTYTRNIGLKNIMSLEERCVYRPSPDNANVTVIDRQAWIYSSFFGFGGAIQAFGLDRFKKNVVKTSKGMNYILERMFPSLQPQTQTPPLTDTSPLLDTEKLRERAKKAKELAKSKAGPFIAACDNHTNQQ